MRVLLIVHAFPPESVGGTEVYVHAQARTLRAAYGDDVLVLARESDSKTPEYALRREVRDGVTIVRVNNTFRLVRSFEESYRNPAIGRIAEHVIDDFAPDVAHIHHLTCLSTAMVPALTARGVPVVLTLHDYWLICHRGQLLNTRYQVCEGPGPDGCRHCLGTVTASQRAPRVASAARRIRDSLPAAPRRRAERAVMGLVRAGATDDGAPSMKARTEHMRKVLDDCAVILAPSRFMRETFARAGLASDRTMDVSLGVDPGPFQLQTRKPSPRVRFGFLGALMISKAPHLLLEAFARLPPGAASLDVLGGFQSYHGDDRYREVLNPLLRQAGVRSHGAVSHEAVVAALYAIDVLVVPSIWPENSPLVVREAFLAGVPVIAARIGGLPEIVRHGTNGLLVEPGSVDDLHRALARFVAEPDLVRTLRAGIPAVTTIEDDVRGVRARYAMEIASSRRPARARMAAVILNYRTADDTFLAVRSLVRSRRPVDEIVIVNNDASAPDQGRYRMPAEVQWIDTGANLGFSGGVNVGIRAALARGAGYVLIANSDIIVPPDAIERLEWGLRASPRAGIAGPLVLQRSDPGRVDSRGLRFDARTGRLRHLGFDEAVPERPADVQRVDAVSGCFMLVAREVFESVGLFDEDYFFGFEDLDLCFRARRAGFDTIAVGDAEVHHEGGRSIGAHSPTRLYFAARNHLLFARRSVRSGVPAPVRMASIISLNLASAFRARGGSLRMRLEAVVRGTRDYFRGHVGDDSLR